LPIGGGDGFHHWDQQAPYQPSGNGIKGQASSLSLAAFGGASTIRKGAKKSSCGARSIVILTPPAVVELNFAHIALANLESAAILTMRSIIVSKN